VCGLNLYGLGYESVADCCENDNESLGSIKGGEFLDQLSDCHLLNKYFVPYTCIYARLGQLKLYESLTILTNSVVVSNLLTSVAQLFSALESILGDHESATNMQSPC
jgi:hypothetical protein